MICKEGKQYATPCFCALRKKKVILFGEMFEDKTIENYEARSESMRIAKRRIKENNRGSFYIYGEVGLGKTHILAGIYDLMYEEGIGAWNKSIVITETELKEEIKRGDIWRRLDKSEAIIIDDMGKVQLASWEIESMFNFYNDIYRYDLQLIISSNYSLQQIAELYGGAITRRIEERCEILHITKG